MLSWVRAGRVEYIHIGIPCTVWSIARRGIKNWTRARQKEEISIALVFFMVRLFHEYVRCGVPVSVENLSDVRTGKALRWGEHDTLLSSKLRLYQLRG